MSSSRPPRAEPGTAGPKTEGAGGGHLGISLDVLVGVPQSGLRIIGLQPLIELAGDGLALGDDEVIRLGV